MMHMEKFFCDTRLRDYLNPARIVMKTGNVDNAEALLSNQDVMRRMHNNATVVMEKGGFLLLDFGKEINGSLRITVGAILGQKSAKVRIRFGESVSEAMSKLGTDNAVNAHFARDTELLLCAMGTTEYGEEGFRFISIELLDDVKLYIQSIVAVFIHQKLEYHGDFQCDDELLNRIWKTGAYTVELNMQDYIFDGIKRDRLVWIGDMEPEVATIAAVFGYDESVKRSLDFVRDNTQLPGWMCGIPTYSMWWIIIHYEWYMHTGDKAYLLEQKEYMLELLRKAIPWIQDFKNSPEPMATYVDWSARNTDSEEAGLKSVFVMAFDAAAKICEVYQEDGVSALCQSAADELRRETLCYGDNKQMASLLAVSGLRDAGTIYEDILREKPSEGISTFMGSYVLKAMAQADHVDTALDVIRTYWGGMLQLGATTFWEDFDIQWLENAARIDEIVPEGKHDVHREYGKHCYMQFRHSLCHGWASGPTSFLSKYVLGIHIVEPGCRVVQIQPNLCGLKWVKGKYPTPMGIIEVEHHCDEEGNVKTTVLTPDGVTII